MANLDLSINWFEDKYNLQFTYDIISTLILFLLIYFFHRLNAKKNQNKPIKELSGRVKLFVYRKKIMAFLLVPVIIMMAIYDFTIWSQDVLALFDSTTVKTMEIIDVNKIFFDEFFTLLILTDVLLLLFSFFHTTSFHVFIRNSGFIISTILIRISFSTDGLTNNILIMVAILFGVLILLITNKYAQLDEHKLKV